MARVNSWLGAKGGQVEGEKGRADRAVTQAGDLWTKCSDSLRDQVSESTWQLWLSGIEPVSFDGGVFVLSVPNGLIRERVESRYLPMIEDTLANEVGEPVRGRLEVLEPQIRSARSDTPFDQVLGQAAGAPLHVGSGSARASGDRGRRA